MKDENGPLIALVAFIILSLIFGYYAYQSHTDLVGHEGEESIDKQIARKRADIEELKDKIEKYKSQAANYANTIKQQEVSYNFFADQYDAFGSEYERRKRLSDEGGGFEQQAATLSGLISDMKQKTLTKYNKEASDVREEMDHEVQEKSKQRDDAISRKNQEEEKLKVDQKKYKDSKNRAQAELSKNKDVLADLTQRDIERSNILSQPNGKVILSDPVTNTVVIDIGTSLGVKNGFCFECFVMRPGQGKVSKGYIKVRTANPSMSECFVVRQVVALPKDALSEYVASQPEEKYSPYQAAAQAGAATKGAATGAQPLSGRPRVVVTGQPTMDPIVEGDLVQNPFFAAGKTRTFFIAGSKKIDNERQKSAIRYPWTAIKAMVEFYGDKVSPVADTNVDFMIMQKSPDSPDTEPSEQEEFKKAKFLGIPVLYEWELFRFLDNK